MAIKLIAFDMDDTLLRSDRTIGQRTLEALRAAHDKGVKIVPATGRGRSTMWKYVEQMGCADAAICTNGAQIYDGRGDVIEENPRAACDRQTCGALCQGKRLVCAGLQPSGLLL